VLNNKLLLLWSFLAQNRLQRGLSHPSGHRRNGPTKDGTGTDRGCRHGLVNGFQIPLLCTPFNRIAKSELGASGVTAICCKSLALASSSCGVGLLPGRVLGVDGEGWGGALDDGDSMCALREKKDNKNWH
jgi:hypothetical protein